MIAKNRAQLKAWIKNMSAKVDVNENIILQNYMLERLLERINVDTTRARDFYDIYILWTTQTQNFDKRLLGQAIIKKFEYRGSRREIYGYSLDWKTKTSNIWKRK